MKVVISGGSGQLGRVLARWFQGQGHEVVVLARHRQTAPWRIVAWDGRTCEDWAAEIDGADCVINLAGRSVNCRYNAANRRAIMDSRIESTKAIGQAIRQSQRPPAVWLQSSTATIYSHRYDAPNDDIDGEIGGMERTAPSTWRFSIDVAQAWEAAANAVALPSTRLVLLRSAMVMTPDRGGVFDTLYTLVRRGLGGTCGDGRQFVSWIHEVDFVRAISWLIDHADLSGPINIASPNPTTNANFMRSLRTASRVPIGLPAAEWMLEIGAFVLRTETELLLKSRRVVPNKLTASRFEFQFPEWPTACADLVASRRAT